MHVRALDLMCVLSYKSEDFCLCQKNIVALISFFSFFTFPIRSSVNLTDLLFLLFPHNKVLSSFAACLSAPHRFFWKACLTGERDVKNQRSIDAPSILYG